MDQLILFLVLRRFPAVRGRMKRGRNSEEAIYCAKGGPWGGRLNLSGLRADRQKDPSDWRLLSALRSEKDLQE